MDARQAAQTLEVIRTLMERTCQYQLLTARASLVAGSLAGAGALAFLWLDPANPWHFGIVWGIVFAGSLAGDDARHGAARPGWRRAASGRGRRGRCCWR